MHMLTCLAVCLQVVHRGRKRVTQMSVLIVIAVLCGIAFAGAAVYAVYQHRALRAIKSDSSDNGYISLNAVGRDSA